MELIINDKKKGKDVQLGDIYIDTENGDSYILLDITVSSPKGLEFPIVLQSLNGHEAWDSYRTLKDFQDNMEVNEEFKHYSKERYLLELKLK